MEVRTIEEVVSHIKFLIEKDNSRITPESFKWDMEFLLKILLETVEERDADQLH